MIQGIEHGVRLHRRAHQKHAPKIGEINKRARTSFSINNWNRSERPQPLVIRRSVISDNRLNANSRVMGDIVEGDAAMDDRRGGGGISSGSSMPRYPYKSASARVSARLADDVDKSDMLAIMEPKKKKRARVLSISPGAKHSEWGEVERRCCAYRN